MARSVRPASTTAIAGALLGIVLTPPMAAVWAYDPPSTHWATMTWAARTFGPWLESVGALSFTWGSVTPYAVYGKGFFLVYLSMIPITRLVHLRHVDRGEAGRWERRLWWIMWISLMVAAAGDFGSYWGYSVPGSLGRALWSHGFGVELLAAAALLLSSTAYGLVSLRKGIVPWWASVLLIAVIPLAAITLAVVVAYIPNGFAVPLSVVWGLVGVWLLLGPRRAEPTDQSPVAV